MLADTLFSFSKTRLCSPKAKLSPLKASGHNYMLYIVSSRASKFLVSSKIFIFGFFKGHYLFIIIIMRADNKRWLIEIYPCMNHWICINVTQNYFFNGWKMVIESRLRSHIRIASGEMIRTTLLLLVFYNNAKIMGVTLNGRVCTVYCTLCSSRI